MGTTAHIVCTGGSNDLLEEAETFLHAAEARWSRFRADSELSRCNRASGRLTVVSAETFQLIRAAVDAWAATGGAFDPTVHDTLVGLGYDRDFAAIVSGAPVVARPAPGCREIEFFAGLPAASCDASVGLPGGAAKSPRGAMPGHPGRSCGVLRLPAGVHLDLGGIAKGHTADLLAARLLDLGALGACVNIGGDVRVMGQAPGGHPWVIALAGSTGPLREATARVQPAMPRIALAAGAVCTSSTRRRRWSAGDREVHHLIDPDSGRSVDTGISVASVIARTAAQAEVLTKAVMVRGMTVGRKLLESLDVAAVLVTDRGDVIEIGNVREFHA